MANVEENKNFRYGYYEKVGFGGIEEKKSLEILIREKPPDLLSRLAQLTSRYSLSSVQRKQVWQLLLDVVRPDDRITEIRCQIRKQIFNDIIRALRLMKVIYTDKQQQQKSINTDIANDNEHAKIILLIYLFETKELRLNISNQLRKVESNDLLSLAEVFLREFYQNNIPNTFEDTYSIFKNFINLINSNLNILIDTFEKFIQNLAIEDIVLYTHLEKNGIIPCQKINNTSTFLSCQHDFILKNQIVLFRPIITWFVRFFTGIIHQNYVIRILDKVIGCLINGSRPFYILISTSKVMMMHLKYKLLKSNDCEELKNILLSPLSMEESERIVFCALNN